jgi:hypothetical protein
MVWVRERTIPTERPPKSIIIISKKGKKVKICLRLTN